MEYFRELQVHWRPLLAALIGFAAGLSFTTTTASVMGPHLIEEFGWTRAQFAAVSGVVIVLLISIPVIGRLTDMIGVRRTALIGVVSLPLSFLVLSAMSNDMPTYNVYVGVILFQTIVCGTTTSTVYSRIVVQYVERSRGLALAIVASGPAITQAVLNPMLVDFVEVHGWRAGYLAIAAFAAIVGGFALLIMPAERKGDAVLAQPSRTREDYQQILKTRAFWILIVAMLLCNLPQVIGLSQLVLVMEENGVVRASAGPMLAAFAIGALVGRFICGVALDRFPASIVAAIGMGLPCVGTLLLASPFDAPNVLIAAVFTIGLSYGAEGDLLGYLVVRHFGVRIYSTVLGLVTASISVSITVGVALVSYSLAQTDSFTPYLLACSVSGLVGALLLLFLRKPPSGQAEPASAEAAKAG